MTMLYRIKRMLLKGYTFSQIQDKLGFQYDVVKLVKNNAEEFKNLSFRRRV